MRCLCCNRNLDDMELTLRHPETNEFLDTCRKCLSFIPITPLTRGVPIPDPTADEDDIYDMDEWIFEETDDGDD